MTNEEIISDFMQKHYSDERVAQLLEWAEDGGLAYGTCCCFIGLATADHSFMRVSEYTEQTFVSPHYDRALGLSGADAAEGSFYGLGKDDAERRSNLIPLIRAEMSRRESACEVNEERVTVSLSI